MLCSASEMMHETFIPWLAVSRSVQGYQTEQNAIEFFSKLRLS